MPARNDHFRLEYGISEDHYDWLLERQGGCCTICSSTNPKSRWGRFYVDHCHNTGVVRGLLCMDCNTALGKLGDSPERLKRAAQYIETKGLANELKEANLPKPVLPPPVFKSANYARKLSWEAVDSIREQLADGSATQEQLALEYGVTQALISRVKLNKTWTLR